MTEELKTQALEAIAHFDAKEAREIIKELEYQIKKASDFTGGSTADLPEMKSLFIRLKLLAFPLLRDDEMIKLIKENAIEMINDTDLVFAERVEARQMGYPESQRFENVNIPVMAALHENNQLIGDGRIYVVGAKSPELPTVKNWFLDYDRIHGTEPQKDLAWLEYVKKNAVSAHLNSSQADTLRKLLKLYEFLKKLNKYEEVQ